MLGDITALDDASEVTTIFKNIAAALALENISRTGWRLDHPPQILVVSSAGKALPSLPVKKRIGLKNQSQSPSAARLGQIMIYNVDLQCRS